MSPIVSLPFHPSNFQANAVLYHLLDLDASLSSQLAHKTIIEYPVLTVVLRSQLGSYSLVPESSLPPPPTQQEQWLAGTKHRAEHQKLYLAGQLPWQLLQKEQAAVAGGVDVGLSSDQAASEASPDAPEAKRQCTATDVEGTPASEGQKEWLAGCSADQIVSGNLEETQSHQLQHLPPPPACSE